MMNQTRITDLYNTLRAVGPLSADEIPARLAKQAMDAGLNGGDQGQCHVVLADLSRVASYGTLAEFESLLASRQAVKPEAGGLSSAAWPQGVDSCEGGGS